MSIVLIYLYISYVCILFHLYRMELGKIIQVAMCDADVVIWSTGNHMTGVSFSECPSESNQEMLHVCVQMVKYHFTH